MPIRWHEEAPEELRAAIRFTGEETGFAPRLIEKDYFCSVILEALAEADVPLIFKGGTCLAKVHSGFFRLSEDLDFSIPTAPDTTRGERGRVIAPVKAIVARLPKKTSGFEVLVPLEGHNASTQYNATLGYRSLLTSRTETIQIEIGLREPILTPPEHAQCGSLEAGRGNSRLLRHRPCGACRGARCHRRGDCTAPTKQGRRARY